MEKTKNNKIKLPCEETIYLHFPCECAGGEEYCGSIIVSDFGDKDIEMLVCKRGRILPIHGVFLKEESIKKLIKYLEKVIK